MEFQLLFVIILLAIATFNSLILIFKKEKYDSRYKFLYMSLFFYNFCLVVYYIWFEAGFIVEAPQLLRTLSPLMYLCAPFFYFFIRNTLTGQTGLRKRDWIHFLPAVIHFVDLLPFYFESAQVKSVFATTIVSDQSQLNFEAAGFIPIQFHYLFRILLQTFYFIFSVYLIKSTQPKLLAFKNWKNYFRIDLMIVMLCLGWLVLFQFVYAVIESMIYLEVIDLSVENYYLRRTSLIGLLGLNIFVNFRLGFGGEKEIEIEPVFHTQKSFKNTIAQSSLSKKLEENGQFEIENQAFISNEETERIKVKIFAKFKDEKLFTQNGMTLNHFSSCADISPKLVSLVINKVFNKNFNEFLNQHRIAFAITKIEEGYLDDYTLEALGQISGFNSRTTFFNAFKKEKGCSPSEYWKKFQESPF